MIKCITLFVCYFYFQDVSGYEVENGHYSKLSRSTNSGTQNRNSSTGSGAGAVHQSRTVTSTTSSFSSGNSSTRPARNPSAGSVAGSSSSSSSGTLNGASLLSAETTLYLAVSDADAGAVIGARVGANTTTH